MEFKIMALVTLVGFSTLSIQTNESSNEPHIVTPGTASVDAILDTATLAIEANIAAKDAASTKKQTDECATQYLSFLGRNQITKKDTNAVNLRTQPDYDYQNGKSIFKGRRVVCTVEVTLRQLNKLNALLDGVLKTDLDEIRSVSLGVAQPNTYGDKARRAAVDSAIHQAEQLAASFNGKLGSVYSVHYRVFNYQPNPMVWIMKADAASAIPAQETYGQPIIQLDDQVDAVFQIEPAVGQPATTPAKTQ